METKITDLRSAENRVQIIPGIIPDSLIDGWERLCERATVAPWVAEIRDPGLPSAEWTGKFFCGFMSVRGWTVWEVFKNNCQRQLDNIRFIEAARTAIPLMIYEIRRLKFEISKMEKMKGPR